MMFGHLAVNTSKMDESLCMQGNSNDNGDNHRLLMSLIASGPSLLQFILHRV